MKKGPAHTGIIFIILLILCGGGAMAQYKVKGTVFDSSRLYRIESVTVMSTGGKITMTDSLGHYHIDVAEKDSIWFSYQGKATPKYAVLKMPDVNQFDIALRLKTNIMEEIKIRSHSYKQDSTQNRKDYARIFNYEKVSLGSMTSIGPNGAGIDLDELIRLFSFKKNKSTLKFQQRLLEQEREKFVDHRFNKALVKRLTGLDGLELDQFMQQYRPTYEYSSLASEYDFQMFIKTAFELYKGHKAF